MLQFDISGKDTNEEQFINKESKEIELDVFHSEMFGKDFNEQQLLNTPLIYFTLDIFHFEISGNDSKEEQLKNNPSIFSILDVSHFEMSGKDFKEKQPENIKAIVVTLFVSQSNSFGSKDKILQLKKIFLKFVIFLVFIFEISGKLYNKSQSANISFKSLIPNIPTNFIFKNDSSFGVSGV